MSESPRDIIWEKIFYTHYYTFFYEQVAIKLIRRWQISHDVSRIIIAITASGTGISGWALWKNSIGVYTWAVIMGAAAVSSIIYAVWDVSAKIKDWTEVKNDCINLRIELEIMRDKMLIDKDFPVETYQSMLVEFKKRYGEIRKRIKQDFFLTKDVNNKAKSIADNNIENYKK
ncbi:MAG: hypothetical protein JW894_02170 [Bacteroidales bacterium]|nr:hypothetical protein [Bacteroidales bacterium]